MAKRSKRCGGRTKDGLRCKNAAKEEFGGFCHVHRQQAASPAPSRSATLSDKVELAANTVTVAGAAIAAVTYVTTHWDAIRTALSTMGWAFITPYEWSSEMPVSDDRIRGLAADAKRISARSSKILSEGIDSATESSRLKYEFARWFKSLPEDVRERTLTHVGRSTLNQLLE